MYWIRRVIFIDPRSLISGRWLIEIFNLKKNDFETDTKNGKTYSDDWRGTLNHEKMGYNRFAMFLLITIYYTYTLLLYAYFKKYSEVLLFGTSRGGEGHLTLDHISILGGRRHFPSSYLSDENAAHHNCLSIVEGIYWKKSSLFFCRLIWLHPVWFSIRPAPPPLTVSWRECRASQLPPDRRGNILEEVLTFFLSSYLAPSPLGSFSISLLPPIWQECRASQLPPDRRRNIFEEVLSFFCRLIWYHPLPSPVGLHKQAVYTVQYLLHR